MPSLENHKIRRLPFMILYTLRLEASKHNGGHLLNFNTSERPFLKILLLTTFPLRSFFCSS